MHDAVTSSLRKGGPLALALVLGCGSPMPMIDAGTPDASPPDSAVPDAAVCMLHPGDLPGTRNIAAGALLPDMTFETATGSVSLTDYHVPCAPRAELIIVRSLAAWSGHSLWHVAHTTSLMTHPQRARFHVIDVLIAGVDGLPSRSADLPDLVARYDMPPDAIGLDPTERFGPVALGGIRLPAVMFIDARTLQLVRPLFVPRAGAVEHEVDVQLARLDGASPPAPYNPTLTDARFSDDEWDLIQGMAWSSTLPPDASNAHADDPAAAMLGAALLADTGLSPAGVACATCHQSAHGLSDGRAVGHGVMDVTRNTPTLYTAALTRWPFWDGRVDSLWAQALGPSENAREMGSSRLFIAHRIQTTHRTAYEAVFGAMPDLSDSARFPAAGLPGDPAWSAMTSADQDTVTRIFTNFGKAIEAHERTLGPPPTRFDAYLAGDLTALSAMERDGLHEYIQDGCADCHFGPQLANGAFHSIAMPGFGSGAALDVGRIAAFDILAASPFRREGAYADAVATDPLAGLSAFPESMRGAFRTPTLRALSETAPYGHAGTFANIHDVVVHYATIRMPMTPDPRVAGVVDPHVVGFDNVPGRVDIITAFLGTL